MGISPENFRTKPLTIFEIFFMVFRKHFEKIDFRYNNL